MKTALSKWIVFLLATRPLLNQLRGDTSLATIGDYNVSILSVWSLLFILVAARRLAMQPTSPPSIRQPVFLFFFIVLVLGVPRMLISEALVTDVLLFVQFFLASLSARAVIDDLGFDYIIGRVTLAALALIVMHATAPAWAPERELPLGNTKQDVDSYLGAYESKHAAAASLFALIPYLVTGAMKKRRSIATLLIVPTAIFMVLAFQRVAIVSLAVFALSCVILSRRIRWLLPLVVLGAVTVAVIPRERFDSFVTNKIEEEMLAATSGDMEEVGAGRMGIILLAQSWYFDDFSPFEQMVGRGTAQAYQLHYLVVGNLIYAHLQFIELIIDYGFIGTFAVFWFLFSLGKLKVAAFRRERDPPQLVGIAMLVVVVLHMFIAMPLQDGGTTALLAFWLFVPRGAEPPAVGRG